METSDKSPLIEANFLSWVVKSLTSEATQFFKRSNKVLSKWIFYVKNHPNLSDFFLKSSNNMWQGKEPHTLLLKDFGPLMYFQDLIDFCITSYSKQILLNRISINVLIWPQKEFCPSVYFQDLVVMLAPLPVISWIEFTIFRI